MVQVLGTHHAHLVDNAIAIQAVFAFATERKAEIVHNGLNSIEVSWHGLETLYSFRPQNSAGKACC